MNIVDDHLRLAMARAMDGDRMSYRFVLDQARAWLERYFARRIAPSLVDDLVQETLVSLHNKRSSFDVERPFLPWLAAIARYRWIDALRRIRNEDELLESSASIDSGEDEVIARLSLARLLAHLPPGQSNAIQLTRIEGRSIVEAARITGQTQALVKINVHRGLKRLAALVENV